MLLLGYVSVSLARLKRTLRQPKQNIKQQECKEQHWNNFLKVVIRNIYCLEIAVDCWKPGENIKVNLWKKMSSLSEVLSHLTDKITCM